MVKLIARRAGAGHFPIEGPGVQAGEFMEMPKASLARREGLDGVLGEAHGLAMPTPGEVTRARTAFCAWFDLGHVMLVGEPPAPAVTAATAVTDQSDAWCHVSLQGPRAAEALGYLTPLDLRDRMFDVNRCARSLIGHMPALVIRTEPEQFELMVFRSMAGTLARELREAFEALPRPH
ncbi:MAG: sarcosine oxidase subunit gamma [Pseudomonadota bacterium]